jgi:hypothetical protein
MIIQVIDLTIFCAAKADIDFISAGATSPRTMVMRHPHASSRLARKTQQQVCWEQLPM